MTTKKMKIRKRGISKRNTDSSRQMKWKFTLIIWPWIGRVGGDIQFGKCECVFSASDFIYSCSFQSVWRGRAFPNLYITFSLYKHHVELYRKKGPTAKKNMNSASNQPLSWTEKKMSRSNICDLFMHFVSVFNVNSIFLYIRRNQPKPFNRLFSNGEQKHTFF